MVVTGNEIANCMRNLRIATTADAIEKLGERLLAEGFLFNVSATSKTFQADGSFYRCCEDEQVIKPKRIIPTSLYKVLLQPWHAPDAPPTVHPALFTEKAHRQGAEKIELRMRAAIRIQRWYKYRQAQRILMLGVGREGQDNLVVPLKCDRTDGSIVQSPRLDRQAAARIIQNRVRRYAAQRVATEIWRKQQEENQTRQAKAKIASLSKLLYDCLDIYDQSSLMRNYSLVFTGEHAVKYMVEHQLAEDVEDALRKGQMLLEHKFVIDVSGNQQIFKNAGGAFYRFQQDQDQLDSTEGKRSSLSTTILEKSGMREMRLSSALLTKSPHTSFGSLATDRTLLSRSSLHESPAHRKVLSDFSHSAKHIFATQRIKIHSLDDDEHHKESENLDDDDVEVLFHRMKCDVKPRKMRHHFRTYQNVFYGEECVSWILKHTHCRTTEQAIDLGNMMVIRRYFAHYLEDRPLENKKTFYRYTDHRTASMRFLSSSIIEDRSWIADWKWKLLMHGIVSDCNKKYKESKLIGLVARKLKRPHMVMQLLNNLRVMAVPFFRLLPSDIYPQVTKLCSYQVFVEGKVLVKAGDTRKRLSVILLGCASTDIEEQENSTLMNSARTSYSSLPDQAEAEFFCPSCCFCEETLRGNPSESTVVASTAGILFELIPEQTDLEKLISKSKNKEAAAQALIYLKMEDVGFKAIKNYPKAWSMLNAFMVGEFAGESINFIDKVDDFKAAPREDHQLRMKMALSILHTFLTKDAVQEVNVRSHQRLAVENALIALSGGKSVADLSPENIVSAATNLQVQPNLFDECYKEVWKLVEKDKLPRFKENIRFKVLLFKLGALKKDPAGEVQKKQSHFEPRSRFITA